MSLSTVPSARAKHVCAFYTHILLSCASSLQPSGIVTPTAVESSCCAKLSSIVQKTTRCCAMFTTPSDDIGICNASHTFVNIVPYRSFDNRIPELAIRCKFASHELMQMQSCLFVLKANQIVSVNAPRSAYSALRFERLLFYSYSSRIVQHASRELWLSGYTQRR